MSSGISPFHLTPFGSPLNGQFKNTRFPFPDPFRDVDVGKGPRFDIRKTDSEVIIHGELPGYTTEDLDIEYEDGTLRIQGDRSWSSEEGTPLLHEIRTSSFSRDFRIRDVEIENAEATMSAGILTLKIPIMESVKPRKIEVKAIDE